MVANFLVAAQFFLGFPENKGSNREALQNRVDQLGGLRFLPDKLALEHWQLDLAGINLNKESLVLFVVIVWLKQNRALRGGNRWLLRSVVHDISMMLNGDLA